MYKEKFNPIEAYKNIYRIRRVEEEIIRLYPSDKIKSPVHLSIGQESVAVGTCMALRKQDVVFSNYRGHAHYLAKGGSLENMMTELYGKAPGTARGKAGSMHLSDWSVGFMGTSAIVASSIPEAVGYAFAMKMQKKDVVTICYFGDGAVDEGCFSESINFAALKHLPILFVCENNEYAIYSHVLDRRRHDNICQRTEAHGIQAVRIEDGDTEVICNQTTQYMSEIIEGKGPRLIECMTQRWRDHVGPGEDRVHQYRKDEYLDEWIKKDQLRIIGESLPIDEKEAIEKSVEKEIQKNIEIAEKNSFPEDKELYTHVYSS